MQYKYGKGPVQPVFPVDPELWPCADLSVEQIHQDQLIFLYMVHSFSRMIPILLLK
jgi:hypothetical protein